MAINATFLFDTPQSEVASLIVDRIGQSFATSIVTGFVTPSGVDAISAPIIAQPTTIDNIIVGAATYPGFEALDGLLAAGCRPLVSVDSLSSYHSPRSFDRVATS